VVLFIRKNTCIYQKKICEFGKNTCIYQKKICEFGKKILASTKRKYVNLEKILASYYYYWYSAFGLVWAETRAQSGDC